jgi:Tfp pilus assembly protein PilO
VTGSNAANVPAATEKSTLRALQASVSSIVPYLEYGSQRLGKLGVLGVSLCFFSFIAFLSGNLQLHRELSEQTTQLDLARQEATSGSATPRIQSPKQRATAFVSELPTRNEVPGIMAKLVAVAGASGIALESGSYEYVAAADGHIARYRASFPITGSYPQIRQFVENTLSTIPVISLDSLRVERDNVSQQVIQADLRFSILLAEGT